MKPESTRPEWVPLEGGEAFATKIVTGVPPPPIFSSGGSVSPVPPSDVTLLARRILTGDRIALARGITLVESRSPAHRAAADDLLEQVTPRAGGALRIGITGVPGAGKSTFIDALGLQMCEAGWRVAVLSVDPSSPVTGGSILGDKTRMERLSRRPEAFIRPSPSGGELGGVARRTRETITLCEAAGFDTVLVETVGVGQSEVVVRGMVDCFLVLMIAGAGDELQGMKKGILELADVLVVNKADGENRVRAEAARLEFSRALHYLAGQEGEWQVPVLACSAQTGERVDEVWQAMERFIGQSRTRGEFDARRSAQQLTWLQALIEEGLRDLLLGDAAARAEHAEIARQVESGTLLPAAAARRLLQNLGWERKHKRRE
jgi:LAO/AO transport system kinase